MRSSESANAPVLGAGVGSEQGAERLDVSAELIRSRLTRSRSGLGQRSLSSNDLESPSRSQSQSDQQNHLQNRRLKFSIGDLYWFRFQRPDTLADGTYFAGLVINVTSKTVFWIWCDDNTQVQRRKDSLQTEDVEKLTVGERALIETQPTLNREETREALRDQPPRHSRPSQPPSQRPAASFGGFEFRDNEVKCDQAWAWLQSFDPTLLLIKRHETEAPSDEEGRQLWRKCVKETILLMQQILKIGDDGLYIRDEWYDRLIMTLKILPILILRINKRDSFSLRSKKICQRAKQFLTGKWQILMSNAVRESTKSNEYLAGLIEREGGRDHDSRRTRLRLALEYARKLHLSKAMGILSSAGLAKETPDEVEQMLKALHPSEPIPGAALDQGPVPTLEAKRFEFINGPWVDLQIRRSKSGTATDQFGWGGREFWWPLRQDDEIMSLLAEFVFRPLAAGYLPEKFREHLAGGRLVAPSKAPKPGIRPICMGDTWRRLVAKGLHDCTKFQLDSYFQKKHGRALQFGGSKHGATRMFHTIAAIADENKRVDDGQQEHLVDPDPVAILGLDVTNAFNCLKREALFDFLRKGCRAHLDGQLEGDMAQSEGWDLLWNLVQAHYGVHGLLKYYSGGKVVTLNSESGVHQGDPLGSTLFALALHPIIMKVAEEHPGVLILAYADNVIMIGKISDLRGAVRVYKEYLAAVGLDLNPMESEAYVPAWDSAQEDDIQLCPHIILQEGEQAIHVSDGIEIPLRKDGIKVLSCPIGSKPFCEELLSKTTAKIEGCLDLLHDFPELHLRSKLAQFCVNTKITYFLRAKYPEVGTDSGGSLDGLDMAFEDFYAKTFEFPESFDDSNVCNDSEAYQCALKQIRFDIRHGGLGLTSATCIAPAALYGAMVDFVVWADQHEEIKARASASYTTFNIESALDVMEDFGGIVAVDDFVEPQPGDSVLQLPNANAVLSWPTEKLQSQRTVVLALKNHNRRHYAETLPEWDKLRLMAVSRQGVPARAQDSDIAPLNPGEKDCSDSLYHTPMSIHALTCQSELSNEAFLVSCTLAFGYPMPRSVPSADDNDKWGDQILNGSSAARIRTHNKIADAAAKIARDSGIQMEGEKSVPVVEVSVTAAGGRRQLRPGPRLGRGDIITKHRGIVPDNPKDRLNRWTRLVLDAILCHVYRTSDHCFKKNNLKTWRQSKNRKYSAAYHRAGFAFGPLATKRDKKFI